MRSLLFGPWSRGAETVIHEGGFEAEQHCELMQRLGVTILCQTPDEYRALAALPEESRRGVRHLRHAVSEGRMLGPDVVEAFQQAFGVSIFAGFAPPETAILVANMPREGMRQGSIGRPLPGHEVVVIDADGREQPLGVEGEIALWGRPASLFSGYWNAPAATDAVFRGEWYLTGDRGTRADGGYLWLSVATDDAAPEAADDPTLFGARAILSGQPAATELTTEVEQEAAAAAPVAPAPEEEPPPSPAATEVPAEIEQQARADEIEQQVPAAALAPAERPTTPAATVVPAEIEREAAAAAPVPEEQHISPAAMEVPAAAAHEPSAAAPAPREEGRTTPARPRLALAPPPAEVSPAEDTRRELSRRNPPTNASDDEAEVDGNEKTLDDVLVARVRAYGQAEPH
jgi:hypothetical protein